MADDAATTTEDTQITFNVKAANDQKHVLTLPNTTTVADLKAKLSTPEYADVPAERQRLIYSGRVLKDPDTLASVKIKDGHTVHLVKGAASNARQNPANQGTSSTASGGNTQTPQVPTNIAAGTGNNPLAGLTGARYAGFHGLPGMDTFGPDGGVSTVQLAIQQGHANMFVDGRTPYKPRGYARTDGEPHVLIATQRSYEQPSSGGYDAAESYGECRPLLYPPYSILLWSNLSRFATTRCSSKSSETQRCAA